jgi:hypothetical protein
LGLPLDAWTLERQRVFFITLDFLPRSEKLLAPRLSVALRAFIDNSADAEAVVALVTGRAGRKFSAFGTWLEEFPLGRPMIVKQLQLAQHAHGVPAKMEASIVSIK